MPGGASYTDKTALGDIDGIASVERAAEKTATRELLDRKELKELIAGRSDVEGLKQLIFHGLCVCACCFIVGTSLGPGLLSWTQFIIGELAFGVVASFYFNGFHECIHGTAFKSRWLNTVVSYILGFATFRGARWYWYFHWAHHRFTNDPELDPELEGNTVDRDDPLAMKGWSKYKRAYSYARFLSGYPFGFERIHGICMHAVGKPPVESFMKTDKARAAVQGEYRVWVCLYIVFVALALLDVTGAVAGLSGFTKKLWYYWLLPHVIGAAHLRYYQTAEHRSCNKSEYTDTSAWAVSRTTTTWAFYCQLAWNMPYHAEHHSWPNVPFHLLPSVHGQIKKRLNGKLPKSGCDPDGSKGYLGIHLDIIRRMMA